MSGSAFRPRARIMKTLGEELISSDSVAIIELVKNAYDADASEVLVKFVGPLKQGEGSIHVIDNGKGMDRSTVERAWMEPATPSKVKNKVSESGRRVLGEKGIGRFAASRLADELELVSRRRGGAEEVRAVFDWTQFDDEEKYLDEVRVLIEGRPATSIAEHGTSLSMSRLKGDWKNISFDEIQRGLSRLVSPFSELPGFKIKIEAPAGFEQYSSEISPPQVIKYPHYMVEGQVNADGTYYLVYQVLASGTEQPARGAFFQHPKSGWVMRDDLSVESMGENYSPPECGAFKVQLRVWDRDELGNVLQMIGGTISSVRKDLDNFAGINIYRDGFRVMPYGEPNNDWLRLDLRRVQKPVYRLSNNQIVGYISITADGNPDLKDQSNREGMRESQAYTDLKDLMFCILSRMEDVRYKSRKKPASPAGEDGVKQGGLFDALDLSGIRQHLQETHPNDALARNLVDSVEADFSRRIESIKKVVARYSGLATLGKLVDAVLHEGRQPLATISGQAGLGQEDLEDFGYSGESRLETVYQRLLRIKEQSKVLSLIFKRIEPFGGRKSGRPPQLYLEKIIQDSFDIFEGQLKSSSISYGVSDTQTLVRLDPHEMQQVFVNLIDNSIYWLQFVPVGARKIFVAVERTTEGFVDVLFSDSGPGVPEEDRDSIFDAYYSTRKDGAGLGLSIVGEMVSNYYGGSLELLSGGDLPGAAFRIRLCKRV
ncbi:histidine kinase [Pseudomonas aeruginosa]|nr:histidine kinase [Pseudomonas aeruginosa]RCN13500.1 Sensor protein EvgS precursor [Pseudomonas aeruginosa]RPM60748.1 histidine kinase [Pseudomonas aeruginosa]RQB43128.1 histidine kinase [Pseudomonas aeruginosa]HBO5119098.1 ATP-binding protein [Pseudomonas aeruginosa]